MDPTQKFLEEVKAKKLPIPVAALEKLFTDHSARVALNPEYVEVFIETKELLLVKNVPELEKHLQHTSKEVLLSLKENRSRTWTGAVMSWFYAHQSQNTMCRDRIRKLLGKIDQYLREEASKYYPENSEEYRSLRFAQTALELVQNNLKDLFSAQELKLLLTKDLIRDVYEASVSHFENCPQYVFFSAEKKSIEVLRGYFIEKLELGLDILTTENMRKKAMKLVGKLRIKQMCRVLEYTFLEELKACEPGKPMDWDLDPASLKGQSFYALCVLAYNLKNKLQEMQEFVELCLSRCCDRSKYTEVPGTWYQSELYACLCRLFIGFVDFQGVLGQSSPALCCHPEVYLWLRRILKSIFQYPEGATCFEKPRPQEAAYFENRFLNTLCKAAGQKLMERNQFRRADQCILSPQELIPETPRPANSPPLSNDLGNILQLNKLQSLIFSLHVSGYTSEADSKTESWIETKKLKVSREAFSWRAGTVSSAISSWPLVSAALLFVPIGNVLRLMAMAAGGMGGLYNSVEQFKSTQSIAQDAGLYLARLIINNRLQSRFISLISYSLGTQVILSCLHELGLHNLAHPDRPAYVTDVVLILGAVNIDSVKWDLVTSVVKGRFLNVYSRQDQVLRRFFTMASNNPIGNTEVIQTGVESCDVTGLFNDELSFFQEHHVSARSLIKKVFKHIGYDP